MAANDKILVVRQEGFIYVSSLADLPNDNVDEFNRVMVGICEGDDRNVVLDLSNVDYLYSRAVGSLVRFYKIQNAKGRYIVVIAPSPRLKSIFESISLTKLIPVFDSLDEFIMWQSTHGRTDESTAADIRIDRRGIVSLVSLSGDIESINRLNLDEKFTDVFGNLADCNHVVVDLSKVISLDESAIFALVALSERLQQSGGGIALAGANEMVKDLLSILGTDEGFSFSDTVDGACSLFGE